MNESLYSQNIEHTFEIPQYSVSEISKLLKNVVEDSFGNIRIRGEISGYKSAASGHAYFNLKDNKAVIKAVGWRDVISKITFRLEDGLEVIVQGRISTYEGQSTYQIVVSKIEVAGQGALLALLEKRKQQLAQEGLFDASRKRPIPFLPKVIGIITSPTGSVIRDILHRINDRMGLHVLIWPVLVQGELAATQIASAIEGFNNLPQSIAKPDVLIVARGGGSIEDLWAFNEEIVVRAAASSGIPLISAIGHETDNTLIDYASDVRAPTPTAAAEMATPVKNDLLALFKVYEQRLKFSLPSICNNAENRLSRFLNSLINFSQKLCELENEIGNLNLKLEQSLSKSLSCKNFDFKIVQRNFSPILILRQIEAYQIKLVTLEKFLNNHITNFVSNFDHKLNSLDRLLSSFDYKKTLDRGFIFAKNSDGKIIRSKEDAELLLNFSLIFKDGKLKVKPVHADAVKNKTKSNALTQNSLFD